jgi:hypothetical protein
VPGELIAEGQNKVAFLSVPEPDIEDGEELLASGGARINSRA